MNVVEVDVDFGGYYAARAAAFEKRLSACAIFGALYDGVDLYDTYPPIRNQLRWLTGAKDHDDARERLKAFSLDGVVDKISCPLLVVHGEDDHRVPARHAQRTYDEARTEKRLILYGIDAERPAWSGVRRRTSEWRR